MNQLAKPDIATALIETIKHRTTRGNWHAHVALWMPDHIHLLVSFPQNAPIQATISKWKEWTAKTLRIEWQRDFFEHRLRATESYREKSDYILMNPVRAGLVARAEDWPFVFFRVGTSRCDVRAMWRTHRTCAREPPQPHASDAAARRPYHLARGALPMRAPARTPTPPAA